MLGVLWSMFVMNIYTPHNELITERCRSVPGVPCTSVCCVCVCVYVCVCVCVCMCGVVGICMC